MNSKLALRYNL